MKLAIVGTRNPSISYGDFEKLLLEKIDLSDVTQIVSGGAKGIDTYAKLLAARHHIPLMEYLPKYDQFGKFATLRRNTQIVQEANVVIAFPSAESKGTYHSIKEAERLHRRLIVVKI
jgi:predicted Rossmann fold nucleotide-binding protein DprA/Smf involved in DNA uptake